MLNVLGWIAGKVPGLIREIDARGGLWMTLQPAVFFYTRSRVLRMLQAAGFSDVNVTRVGKLHCVVAS